MPSFWTSQVVQVVELLLLLLFMASPSISAAASTLPPEVAPSLPPYYIIPEISPDIAPLLPAPGGEAPAPADQSSMPFIPSTLSPPNPDATAGPGSDPAAVSPSGSLLSSSSAMLFVSFDQFVKLAVLLVLVACCSISPSGV
ncbi:hypothetical protein Nepgr_010200 [Nepenthes gracilis]|uniref:Uncharacterized protein n=1 Tax=Nepenthes gracilis TaxID=150966 RepID=A0AAD3SBX6_NEPGR|nr:hypothetical protein Nepgr_010200 [Nepenthes gracilis]